MERLHGIERPVLIEGRKAICGAARVAEKRLGEVEAPLIEVRGQTDGESELQRIRQAPCLRLQVVVLRQITQRRPS